MQRILCVCPNPVIDIIVRLDRLEPGAEHRTREESHYPGGKGINVAKVLSRLGYVPGLLCFWPRENSQWLRQHCERVCGIVCRGPRISGWTRSHISLHEAGGRVTELVGPGPEISTGDFERLLAEFKDALEVFDAVALSGSWPRGAPDNAYARMLELVRRAGRWALLDCAPPWLAPALNCGPRALHLNLEEARRVAGKADAPAIARELNKQCEVVCLTDGAQGAWLAVNRRVLQARVQPPAVVSALGAGDSLVAGMLKALAERSDPQTLAALAVACGAANCLQEQSGWIETPDLNALLKEVRLENLG